MKIIDSCVPRKTAFKNIGVGKVFIDFDTYFMKVPKVIENLLDERNIERNAISLDEDAEYALFTLFDEDDEVIPVDAELVIKSKGTEKGLTNAK